MNLADDGGDGGGPRVERPISSGQVGALEDEPITEALRERTRARMLAAIPRWYTPIGHLVATTGVGVVTLALAIHFVARPSALEFLTVPLVFLVANFYEWAVHKYVLHRRFPLFHVIYERHTPEHHVVYVEGDMELRSLREFRFVLIPAAGVLGITLAAAPLAYVAARIFSANVGWLFLVTASLYMVAYELTHLAYHLPSSVPLVGTRVFQALRRHHARHHDPRRMQRENFNVTFPIADFVLGTIAKDLGRSRLSPRR